MQFYAVDLRKAQKGTHGWTYDSRGSRGSCRGVGSGSGGCCVVVKKWLG